MSRQITVATQEIGERSTKDTANNLKGKNNAITNVPVFVDDTCRKRGFPSLNGVVTAISVESGKILDSEIMSRKCKGCVIIQDLETTDSTRYEDWKVPHECGLNYK